MPPIAFRSGVRPDPPDPRDRQFVAATFAQTALTASPDFGEIILPARTPISNQGQLSSCVANAGCDALELIMPDPVRQLSRLFGYWNARRSHGEEDVDKGTFIRAFFASINKIGISPEDLWPYDPSHVNERPPLFAYESAFDHRISGYYRIGSAGQFRLDDVEAAIRSGHPVVLSMQVGEAFCSYAGEEMVFHPPTRPVGLHAMVVVGIRREGGGTTSFKLRNSWGTDWGQEGYAWAAEDWISDFFTTDLWVPTYVPEAA